MADSEFLDEQGISLGAKNIMHEYFTDAVVALVNSNAEEFEMNYQALKGYLDPEQFAGYLNAYANRLFVVLETLKTKI